MTKLNENLKVNCRVWRHSVEYFFVQNNGQCRLCINQSTNFVPDNKKTHEI